MDARLAKLEKEYDAEWPLWIGWDHSWDPPIHPFLARIVRRYTMRELEEIWTSAVESKSMLLPLIEGAVILRTSYVLRN